MLGKDWPQLCLSLWEPGGDTAFKLCQKNCGLPTTNHRCILCLHHSARHWHPWRGQKTMLKKGTSWILSLPSCVNIVAPFFRKSGSLTSLLLVGHVNKHASVLMWKSTHSPQTGGDKLTRLNWINGCAMCNDMKTWAGAFVWRMCY